MAKDRYELMLDELKAVQEAIDKEQQQLTAQSEARLSCQKWIKMLLIMSPRPLRRLELSPYGSAKGLGETDATSHSWVRVTLLCCTLMMVMCHSMRKTSRKMSETEPCPH